jgi:hypothetical protein
MFRSHICSSSGSSVYTTIGTFFVLKLVKFKITFRCTVNKTLNFVKAYDSAKMTVSFVFIGSFSKKKNLIKKFNVKIW